MLHMTPHFTYRPLTVDEWPQLESEFTTRNVPMPDPKLATIYAAFDEALILRAFLVCQFKLHSEPLVSWAPLAVPGLLAFAENSLIGMGLGGIECFIGADQVRVRSLAWTLGFHPYEAMFVKRIGSGSNGRSEEAKAKVAQDGDKV